MNNIATTYKILVADDEPHVAAELKFSLENTEHVQHRVLNAFTGEDAFKKALQERPDLIILDMMMPKNVLSDIDPRQGVEVYKKLQENPDTKKIDTIFSSAFRINNIEDETSDTNIQQFIKFHDDEKKYAYINQLIQNRILSQRQI